MSWWLIAAAAFVGLFAGWMATTVAYRIPLDLGVRPPLARCPHCQAPATGWDRTPLLSYVLLGGRCRNCRGRISLRYPVVELGSALLFAGTTALVGPRFVLPAYLWFVAVTVTLLLTDLDHQRIPNRILFPGILVGFALLASGAVLEGELGSIPRAILGGAIYFGVMALPVVLTRGRAFGMGDVKLALLLGLFLAYPAWGYLIWGIALGLLTGGLVAIVLLVSRRKGPRDEFAYGPAMILGTWLALSLAPALQRAVVGG